jgi:hypothetical protein
MRSPHPEGTKRAEKGRFGALWCLLRPAMAGSSSSGGTAAATATGGSAWSRRRTCGCWCGASPLETQQEQRSARHLFCFARAIWAAWHKNKTPQQTTTNPRPRPRCRGVCSNFLQLQLGKPEVLPVQQRTRTSCSRGVRLPSELMPNRAESRQKEERTATC